MKRLLLLSAILVTGLVAAFLLLRGTSPTTAEPPPASPATSDENRTTASGEPADPADPSAVAPSLGENLDTPSMPEELLREQGERDRPNQVARAALLRANIARVDEAIRKARAEGGNPEYIAALEKRRSLLQKQAAAEREGVEPEGTPQPAGK